MRKSRNWKPGLSEKRVGSNNSTTALNRKLKGHVKHVLRRKDAKESNSLRVQGSFPNMDMDIIEELTTCNFSKKPKT